MFNLFRNVKSNKILKIGKEVQEKVDIELIKLSQEPIKDCPLYQLGIENGFEIVKEFNSEGEYGIAFEHILYMIDAGNIVLSNESKDSIYYLSEKMKISIETIQSQLKK